MSPALAYERAAELVAGEARLPVEAILQPAGRQRRELRQMATYLAIVGGGVGLRALAREVGMARTTIRAAARRMEDLRDDAGIDRRLGRLEQQLRKRR